MNQPQQFCGISLHQSSAFQDLKMDSFFETPSSSLDSYLLGGYDHPAHGGRREETNDNHVTIDMASYGSDIWPAIDSSLLEELNSWTQEAGQQKENTDGEIYTLKVLNGTDQTGCFKQEESLTNSSIDLDSLLNDIPSNVLTNSTGFNNNESPIWYENRSIIDSDSPSSAYSMDEMFLTHLDVSSPEEYEKLNRIETEVAESVDQFWLDRSYIPSGSQISPQPMIGLVAKPVRKYTKRSKNTTPTASSSSGVRKGRSLHYCNICRKGFKDRYSVSVHLRTHTGEKPFLCTICGKTFRQKAHLEKHGQTHRAQPKNGIRTSSKSTKNFIPSS